MDYKETAQSGNSYSHMWDVETTREFEGGFLFDKTTVPTGTEKLPKGVFLKVDHVERKATLVKTAVLAEAITVASEAVRIEKGALLVATDVIGVNGKAVTVGVIDTSNADYDSFAIVAGSLGALEAGTVLQQCAAVGVVGTKGVYELTISTNPTAGDKITIAGTEYEFAAAPAAGRAVVGATAAATAANLDDVLDENLTLKETYDVTYSGAKVIFTQKVAGVGAIPALVVTPVPSTGTLAAAIAATTTGVAASGGAVVNPDGLNYREIELDAQPSCSVIYEARGIKVSRLPQGVTEAIKSALKFMQFIG